LVASGFLEIMTYWPREVWNAFGSGQAYTFQDGDGRLEFFPFFSNIALLLLSMICLYFVVRYFRALLLQRGT
jgi:hypothetical protein